jgi:hypothetical protein
MSIWVEMQALHTHPGILHGSLFLGSILFVALFHFGGLALLGSQYTAVDAFLGIPHLLTYGTTFGVLLALLGASLGPHLLGWALLVPPPPPTTIVKGRAWPMLNAVISISSLCFGATLSPLSPSSWRKMSSARASDCGAHTAKAEAAPRICENRAFIVR